MCLAIYPLSSDEQIEIAFALERIYQRRDGGANIWLDVLVHNTRRDPGADSISRLRILVPYALIDLTRLKVLRVPFEDAIKRLPPLREKQLQAIRDQTHELATPDDEANWIYKAVKHSEINRDKLEPGVFAIQRGGKANGPLEGFLKQRWRLGQPDTKTFDDIMWLLFAVNKLAVFDVACDDDPKEQLHPGEKMWLRLALQIPADSYNRQSLLLKVTARTYEYRQVFTSAHRICQDAEASLRDFEPKGYDRLDGRLAMAKMRISDHLPTNPQIRIRDWRTFMYREYGLGVRKVEQLANDPRRPSAGLIVSLPPAADPPRPARIAG